MLKKIMLAAAALGVSSATFAHEGRWERREEWRESHFEHRQHYQPYYYAPQPVYVLPPRVVYAPVYPQPYYAAPAYYPPAPVYRPVPVYPAAPGVSIRFNFPL